MQALRPSVDPRPSKGRDQHDNSKQTQRNRSFENQSTDKNDSGNTRSSTAKRKYPSMFSALEKGD
jgi:hypothetical protein